MDGSGEGQMMVRWSGEFQVRVKSQKYSELDTGGRETCLILFYFCLCFFLPGSIVNGYF